MVKTMNRDDWMDSIGKEAFESTVRKVVESFFEDRWGYGSREDVTRAISEAVHEMVRSDPEIRARIKKRLIEVIERGESRA